MTYGKLKNKILAHLDLSGDSAYGDAGTAGAVMNAMAETVNGTARKVAAATRSVIRRATVSFSYDGLLYRAALPDDFISLKAVYIGGCRKSASDFDCAGRMIYSAYTPEGQADVFYYAYPVGCETLDDGDELEFDDSFADIVSYGAAAELCAVACPADGARYASLMTEYDERMAYAYQAGGKDSRVYNSIFSGRRIL